MKNDRDGETTELTDAQAALVDTVLTRVAAQRLRLAQVREAERQGQAARNADRWG